MPIYSSLAQLLERLNDSLKLYQLWSDAAPSREALASTQPFAVDTLTIEQWLQFILVPKLMVLIETKQPLPTQICVLPIVEQSFAQRQIDAPLLISTVAKIDRLLGQQHHA